MNVPFRASCSACGVGFQVNDAALVGKRVRCPKCKQPTVIEAPANVGGAFESPAEDPLGLGDLSSFGGAAPGASPFPSNPFPNAAFPNAPFPPAGGPMPPGASHAAAGFPTAGAGAAPPWGAAARPQASPVRTNGPLPVAHDKPSWWSTLSFKGKMRLLYVLGAVVLSVVGSIVAFLGKTAGIGYVGSYASRPDRSLRELRASFKTDLRVTGPAPHKGEAPDLPGAWNYPSSGELSLQASLQFPEGDGPFPAVVYCHGGFSLDRQDIRHTEALLKAGFAVYAPTWRGENGNPGAYELCYGEAADCVAAMEYLARREDIDPESIFLAGHSLGAINAMLAAELSSRPRGAVAIGGMLDMYSLHVWQPKKFLDEIPFDTTDEQEDLLRSPAKFLADLTCPLRVVYGDDEFEPAREQGKALAAAAAKLGKQVEYVELKGANHSTSLQPALVGAIDYFRQLMQQPRQTPAPPFEDRTPEWIAKQMANLPAWGGGERLPAETRLAAAWTVQPDPGPAQNFAPLYELAEQYGFGTPIIAGPQQWWSVSVNDKDFVVRDLANRTSHRVTGRRSLVDDRSWGGSSGFQELSPDGKLLFWRMESGGDVNNLPKQQIVVQRTQDLGFVRTIERAAEGQFLSADLVLVSRPTFSGKPPDFQEARAGFRLPHALRRVNLTTGEESAEVPVRAGGIWSISPGKNWLVVAHPTANAEPEAAKSKEAFQGQASAMELAVIDLRTWNVVARGEYRGVPSGRAMAWSGDGKLLASVAAGGGIGLWDVTTGQAATLTGLSDVPRKGAPTVQFLDVDQLLLIDGAHLLRVSDGRKIGQLQPAPGIDVASLQWVGDRYRPRNGGAFMPFPFEQLRAELRQAADPASNLMIDRQVELSVEAQPGEQLAPGALEFVRKQLPAILKRRFDLTVVERDGKPHVLVKVRYGEKLELTRASANPGAGGAGSKQHDYRPLNLGGKQVSRVTFELATPDGRAVHSDFGTAEVKMPYVELTVPTDVQLRAVGLLQAFVKMPAKLPMVVARDGGGEVLPRNFALSASPPAKSVWNLPETTGGISTAAATISPETTNLPARRTILVEDRNRLKSSRYVLGIPLVDGRPTLVVHGTRGDTEWIPLDPQAGAPSSTSLGQVLPTFSPAGGLVVNRANTLLEFRSIGPGGALGEAKAFTFPANMTAFAWSRSGRFLAAGLAPGVIEVYDTEQLRTAAELANVKPVAKLATNGLVTELAFSVDEQRIAAVDAAPSLVAFDLTSGMQAGRFALPPSSPGRGAPQASGGVAFSADGRRLFGFGAGTLVAFDLSTGKEAGQWPVANATALIPSPDGRWFAILQSTLEAQLRRSDAPETWRSLRLETKNRVVTTSVDMKGAWSGDGRIFAATDQRGTTTVWDVEP